MSHAMGDPHCNCFMCKTREERAVILAATAKTEGVKLDAGKPRTDLLPGDALLDVARVLEFGAKKYAARNWEMGMDWGRLLGAAFRHLWAWSLGEATDPESGLPHLAHASCCVLMLQALVLRKVGTDDRYKPAPESPDPGGLY
jgi:hypothetical protein